MGNRAPFQPIYQDEKILVVAKKDNVLTVATKDPKTYHQNLLAYLRKDFPGSVYPVHRLDYETSGLLIFARDRETQNELKECFLHRTVRRFYEAVVKERLPLHESFEVHQLLEEKPNGKVVLDPVLGKEAITQVTTSNAIQIGTALKIEIETGRKNQIRMALAAMGWTLLGDTRYGKDEPRKRMYLNAYRLSFPSTISLSCRDFSLPPLWLKEEANAGSSSLL